MNAFAPETPQSAACIAVLNDVFRAAGPNADWRMSRGVAARGVAFVIEAVDRVRAYAFSTSQDDPYRDFGVFVLGRVTVWFKIDYYDRDCFHHSDDPADPHITRRVLTLLLPDEC